MKQLMKLLLLFVFSNFCLAKTTVLNDVKDLDFVNKHIKLDKAAEGATLVVFDIDDTLLEAVNFVGSDKWYNWQRGKKVHDKLGNPIKIQDTEKFLCIFSTLGTLFELGTSKLTQEDAAHIINELRSYDLMLLTSRSPDYRGATERELSNNGINLNDEHLINMNTGLVFNIDDRNRTAKVTYQNGLVMSSGINKGLVLKSILKRIGKTYQRIYFVDDSRKNINNMEKAWQKDETQVSIFHYTKVDKSISQEEINQSIKVKRLFNEFLSSAYPDRSHAFLNNQCL